MKKLILTALGSVFLTACIGQCSNPLCDSSISVCPKLFDRLVRNDVLSQQYKAYSITLLAEVSTYKYVVNQKDSVISGKDKIIQIQTEENKLSLDQLKQSEKDLKKEKRKNRLLGLGNIASWVIGITTTTYFIFH